VRFPIYLDDSSGTNLSAEQNEGNPIMRIDEDGTVHALREGMAVLMDDFDGIID
jgi:hypothetical protein